MFQIFNALADRRWRHAQCLGGKRKASHFRNLQKFFNTVEQV